MCYCARLATLRWRLYLKRLTKVDNNDAFLQEGWGRVKGGCDELPVSLWAWWRAVKSFNLFCLWFTQHCIDFALRPSACLVGYMEKHVVRC